MEARARKTDPVHGLAGIAKTHSQKLDNLTSELAFVNQQNKFHRQHSVVVQQEQRQCRSNGASSSMQEVDSSLTVGLSLSQM
ncbi:hypothetical protein MKX03_001248 [Papaver bracteatum]|nr:hypothetical protein MKX03_001248 [Papaver bracteatum]